MAQEGKTRKLKSKAKAAGLKSTFVIGNELYMTSFGNGNDAIVENHITNDSIDTINKDAKFSVKKDSDKKDFIISSKGIVGRTENPLCNQITVRQDLVGCKQELERIYFQRDRVSSNNNDDNIYIQIAHNILDINKILTVHVNNIVYAISNIAGFSGGEDLIGHISANITYSSFTNKNSVNKFGKSVYRDDLNKLLEKLINSPRLAYFGNAFYNVSNDKKQIATSKKNNKKGPSKNGNKSEIGTKKSNEDIYNMLAFIGTARQTLSHSTTQTGHYIYNLAIYRDRNPRAVKMLNYLYENKINSINYSFLKMSKINLTLIFSALDAKTIDEKKKITQSYYDFVVRKEYKNMGFSVKKLREIMVENYDESLDDDKKARGMEISNKNKDTVRSKFYSLFDFIISYYYNQNPQMREKFVSELRACANEEDKESLYSREAKACWEKFDLYKRVIYGVLNKIKGGAIKYVQPDRDIKDDFINSCCIKANNVELFVKYIYMLTLFIDGKEINDLLTTLINKFENIASFIDVLNYSKIKNDCKNLEFRHSKLDANDNLVHDYSMFENSRKIAQDLRVVNSFARMQVGEVATNNDMLRDALAVLGAQNPDKEVERIREKENEKDKRKRDTNLRNFLINNVINSSRFKYIVRYSNVDSCRYLAKNYKIVKFVLNELPEKQIDRYYKACIETTAANKINASYEDKVNELALMIGKIEFAAFKDVKNDDRKSSKNEKATKGHYRAVIGLYLTVLYLLTKNLVYVNSRYSLAFHCLERDYQFIMGEQFNQKSRPYFDLIERAISENKLKPSAQRNIKDNLYWIHSKPGNDNTKLIVSKGDIKIYRDSVMHLNVIRDAYKYLDDIEVCTSYFAIYNYMMQKYILNKRKNCNLVDREHMNDTQAGKLFYNLCAVKEKKGFSKDLVKMLNTPFAYNYARYQNLTCEGLFDMNRPMEFEKK